MWAGWAAGGRGDIGKATRVPHELLDPFALRIDDILHGKVHHAARVHHVFHRGAGDQGRDRGLMQLRELDHHRLERGLPHMERGR